MSKGKAPKAPDPYKTAMAQSKMNMSNAGIEQLMNMTDQVGPDGTLTYSANGFRDFVDPFTGKIKKIPTYKATTMLSDAQQGIKGRQDAAQFNLAGLLQALTGKFQGILDEPFSLDNDEVEGSIIDRFGKRLGAQQDRDRESMESDILARGIRPGSAAYDVFKRQQGEKENDAWNQIFLNARGQAVNEKLTERNQPFKEFAALLNGSQIDQPTFGSTPGANLADVDYAGLVNQNYQNQLQAYQSKQDGFNKALGGMFGLAGTAIKYSDRRLKEDVERVGETPDDLGIYKYRYKSGGPMRLGLMAQDVERKMPGAVTKDAQGYRKVDYKRALRLGA